MSIIKIHSKLLVDWTFVPSAVQNKVTKRTMRNRYHNVNHIQNLN